MVQSYAKEYEEPGYTANDNCDGDLTSEVKVTKEDISETEYNLKYEVSDKSGNSSMKIRKITLIDDIPPVLKINGSSTIAIVVNESYQDKGATAFDEKDGDLTDKIVTEGSVDTSKVGTYTITYKVSDTKGNESQKTRLIKVIDKKIQVSNGESGKKGVIYLTFDDGPSSSITPKILNILKEKNVKATFFILNYNSTGEKLVQREYAEGHTIAIHGYSHDYATIYKSDEAFMNNITKLQTKISNSLGGYQAKIIRFPGGSSNTISRKYSKGIMTRLCSKVLASGYRYFDWNVSSGDAGGAKNSNDVYKNVTKNLSKSRANVVLMHDFSGNTKTLNALADIIDFGYKNGYTFSSINENTPMVTHTPNN